MRMDGRGALGVFLSDEGGYTSVATAVAMLLSCTLLFSAAAGGWVMSRTSEIQPVADAAAQAGENVVAAYSTIYQVVDACVLSMGLAGVLVMGTGLVMCAVPGLGSTGVDVVKEGANILDKRRDFAAQASGNLERLEGALPGLIVANSFACVEANDTANISYAGASIPFPQTSLSEFDSADDVDSADLERSAEELSELSDVADELEDEVDDALYEGWLADCGDSPRNMCERASTLAGMGGAENPDYPSPEGWNFGVALSRARAYYAHRLAQEGPYGPGIEAITDSCARRRFYSYALAQVRSGHYEEGEDGSVDMDLPHLPHNVAEVKLTELYSEIVWPLTKEEQGVTLHSTSACPGATGPSMGAGSLLGIDVGISNLCPVCRMNVGDMGKVAAASTSIDNGFEHYWRRVVEASEAYEDSMNELVETEKEMKGVGSEGNDAFEEALQALAVERPRLCPPGAWGCIAVVTRGGGTTTPPSLSGSFITQASLPAGAAVAGATLAPDEATRENNVLAGFFDGLHARSTLVGGVLDGVAELWGSLLIGYGSAYSSVTGAADKMFDLADSLIEGDVARWLQKRIYRTVEAAGFKPNDMRLRKPVLVNTQKILDASGSSGVGDVRRIVQRLPANPGVGDFLRVMGMEALDRIAQTDFTIADLPVPGTDLSIPLSLDISALGGASP